MATETENLDKCFEVVSAVVQKAGDVSLINLFKNVIIEWKFRSL